MVRILVTRPLPDEALAALRELGEVDVHDDDVPMSPAELRRRAAGTAAVVALPGDTIDDAVLEAAGPTLRIVANFAVGYDNLDVEAFRRREVAATNTPDTLVDATADLAFGLILAAARRLAEGDRFLRARGPWRFRHDFMLGQDVSGATLGIVGLGAIGSAVARRARGFSMPILYTQRRDADPALARELGARRLPLDELLAQADIVSLHCPLTPETWHLLDARALARMRPHAVLVNTARGPVIDEAALVEALRSRRIFAAGLDVFEREPEVHRGLVELENVVLVPHLGSATAATRRRMGLRVARNVAAALAGERPPDDVR